MNHAIIITGCQRSGTTLLNLILDSHPQVHGIDEMAFQPEQFPRYLQGSRFGPWVCLKLPAIAHQIGRIARLRGVRVLYCLRDPRDVAASMLQLMVLHDGVRAPWAAHPLGAQREIDCGVNLIPVAVRQELRAALESYDRCRTRSPADRSRADQVLAAALCWRIKTELFPLYAAMQVPALLVVYERLLADPKNIIGEILQFLGLPWHDDVLRHHQLHHGFSVGNTVNERPIDPGNVGKWQKFLGAGDVAVIRDVCGPAPARLGYDL